MWPFIRSGDKILVKNITAEDLSIGDVILYRVNGYLACHRLIKKALSGSEYLLYTRGDNTAGQAQIITADMLIGRVTGVLKRGRVVNFTSLLWMVINRFIAQAGPFVKIAVKTARPFYAGIKSLRRMIWEKARF